MCPKYVQDISLDGSPYGYRKSETLGIRNSFNLVYCLRIQFTYFEKPDGYGYLYFVKSIQGNSFWCWFF